MYDQERQEQLRKLWKLYHKQCDRAVRRFCKRTGLDFDEVNDSPWTYMDDGLRFPPFPDGLSEMTSGARTRAGTPCKRKDLYRSGRCKLHGGLSTGPTSEEGKRKVAKNGSRNKAHERLIKVEVAETQ